MKFNNFLFTICLSLILQFSSNEINAKLSCKNEQNQDVDWFIILKYPNSANYFYLTPNNIKWTTPNFGLDSSNNLVAITLQQAYRASDYNAFYAFYDDSKASNLNSSPGGHLKGVVNFDNTSGYWMIHSVPRFPTIKSYIYPDPETINGQSFICLSLNTKSLTDIGKQLLFMYADVYSYNIPPGFTKDEELNGILSSLVHNSHSPPSEKTNIIQLQTLAGLSLMHFGKSKNFINDIYDDMIVKKLNCSLFTETWQHGFKLPSSCDKQYKVYNVIDVSITGLKFNNYNDHSKWAVSDDKSKPFVCIGDLNRVKTQFLKGGGSLCIQNENVWIAFQQIVLNYEKCP